jgi:hypothetical protein
LVIIFVEISQTRLDLQAISNKVVKRKCLFIEDRSRENSGRRPVDRWAAGFIIEE